MILLAYDFILNSGTCVDIGHAGTRPILSFSDALFRAVEQVDLVQSGTLAQLHDLDTEVPHGLGGAGVLHALTPVAGFLHIGLASHFSCADAFIILTKLSFVPPTNSASTSQASQAE